MADLVIQLTTVDKIAPHPNADKLELAVVGGWQVVTGIGNWHEGDKCVYFPPDCMLPEERCKEFEIENYVSRSNRYPGFGRLRAIKLRGEPSFGLIVPPPAELLDNTEFIDLGFYYGAKKFEPPKRLQEPGRRMYGWPDDPDKIVCTRCIPEGADPRDLHEIYKKEARGLVCTICGYTKPIAAYSAAEVPTFPRYTDIQNLRHYPTEVFLPGEKLVITEKIHGANCRVGVTVVGETPVLKIKTWQEMAGSHNVRRSDPSENGEGDWETTRRSDTYWFPWTMEPVQKLLKELHEGHSPVAHFPATNSVIIYGEVYGPGIQTITYGREELGFVAFDIKIDGRYLPWAEFSRLCRTFGVPHVPALEVVEWEDGRDGTFDIIRAHSIGKTTLGGDHMREGVVVRPLDEERSHPKIGRVIMKFVSDDFLTSSHHDDTVDDDEFQDGEVLGERGDGAEEDG